MTDEVKLVYKPPKEQKDLRFLKAKELCEDTYVIPNVKPLDNTCISCEAMSHLFKLRDLKLEDKTNLDKIRDALVFILENIDWPVSD